LKLETPVDYLIKNNFVSKMCWTNTNNWQKLIIIITLDKI